MKFVSDAVVAAYLKLQALSLATMFCHRLAFLLWHGEAGLISRSWRDLLSALWLGARFDASTLVYANSIPLLIYFFIRIFNAGRLWNAWKRFALGYWTLTFLVIQILATLDFFYYMHFQDRFNVIMVGFFTDDTRALVSTIWKNYPIGWGAIAMVALGVSGHGILARWISPLGPPVSRGFKRLAVGSLLVLALSILIGRGSLTFYPLGLIHTQVSVDPFVNLLTVNAPFRIKTALKQYFQSRNYVRGNIKAYGFDGRRDEAFALAVKTLARPTLRLLDQRPHIVVVLMESMGSYWMQFEEPRFDLVGRLRDELKDAAYTLRMVPGHIGTIGSVSSVMSGVPHGTRSAILSESPYQKLQMPTSPALFFNQLGYNTRFVYGGNLGWRGIGDFARRQGFKFADGEVEIEMTMGKLDGATHDWGVFDDRLFSYVMRVLESATEPEFVVVMTTSNHPPFEVPESYAAPVFEIPESLRRELLVDETIARARFVATRFAHDSLAEFRARMKAKGLAGKSVLAVTGDHGFWFARIPSDQVAKKYLVPFAIWLPSEELVLKLRERMGRGFLSHLHILPTLYDLVAGAPEKALSFLPSLFSGDDLIGYSSQSFALFPERAVTLDQEPRTRCYADLGVPLVELIPCADPGAGAEEIYKAYNSAVDFYLEDLRQTQN